MLIPRIIAIALSLSAPSQGARVVTVRSGLEVALTDSLRLLQGKPLGLITNHTGVDRGGRRNIDLLYRAPGVTLVALFGPEHGIGGVVPGGDRIASGRDSATGLPVYSLYGETRVPTAEMLKDVEALVYDIQDIGSRTYTYVWTMALAAEAAGKLGKEFIVLDRPNPIRADRVDGSVLEPRYRSFVGQYDVALRYGLTPGELLRYLAGTGRVSGVRISIVPMQGYRRSMFFHETGLPWVNPSPNIRDEEAAVLYPGTVFFEATNLSEGRGTDAPLRQVGAAWLSDAAAIVRELNALKLRGIQFESTQTAVAKGEKQGGKAIPMIRLHVRDASVVDPVAAAVWTMRTIYRRHPREWKWQENGIERLAGTAALRRAVERGGISTLLERWRGQSRHFQNDTRPYWLY